VCACGQRNVLLMPIAVCGLETVWDVRCVKCGAFAWFDARTDERFGRALAGGADPEERDRLFVAALSLCDCGGSWRVVRELEREPCIACGRPLGSTPLSDAPAIDVPPLGN
jgi:hypothetical protein